MQQGDFSSESVRFASDGTQSRQFVAQGDGQTNSSIMSSMQQNQAIFNAGAMLTTPQPPPYQSSQPLPSMTHAFSQQRQGQFSANVSSPHLPYKGVQASYQGQPSYNVSTGAQAQTMVGRQVASPSSVPAISPGAQMTMPQAMQSLSPGATAMPRKSLTGMMSPIRAPAQQALSMPPPGSPVLRMQAPISPLSVYMSQAQSPRRTPVGHAQGMAVGNFSNTQGPAYHQSAMAYAYGPQQSSIPPSSPVPSPRYLDSSQHSQMSPMIQTQGHMHSSQQVPQSVQVQRSPFKAARQLSMTVSPTKAQPYSAAAVAQQQWQYSNRSTSQEMWEATPTAQVIPSLPVLSSDTLDLLSTLTVSTVTSPVRSSVVPGITGSRVPKSPLLQQHLLMPAQPIRPPLAEGNLLAVSGNVTSMTTIVPTVVTPSVSTQGLTSAAPPSRSGQKQSVRPLVTATEETRIVLNKPVISSAASTVTTSTLTSSIVTSVCSYKTEDPKEMGDSMDTLIPSDKLAMASKNGDIGISRTAVELTNSAVNSSLVPSSTGNTYVPVSESFLNSELPQSPEPPPVSQEVLAKRTKLCEIHKAKLLEKLGLYKECLTELFFLQNGGNFMDYSQFKKKPSTKLLDYLKKMMPENKLGRRKLRKISQDSISSNGEAMSPSSDASSSRKASSEDFKKARSRSASKDTSSERVQKFVPTTEKALLKRSQSQEKPVVVVSQAVSDMEREITQTAGANLVPSLKGQLSPLRLKRLSRPVPAASLDESIGSQEEILERAKQEAVIQRKVVELRKQGLWTQRRLPKVQDPPRNKTHWDYLLEEMRWLSADFAQERKWKRAAARKLVRGVAAYHKEQHDLARRAKREEHNRLRRIAATMAREIRIFWGNIGKVVEYKQRSLLDEKRQKALDLHLSYIVDQTEKYSDWLTQGLNKPQPSVASSPSRSLPGSKRGSDDEFLPQGESSDDEETIAVAEQELAKQENTDEELSLLKQESELPFEELLSTLPPELIENIGKPLEDQKEAKSGDSSVEEKGNVPQAPSSAKEQGSSDEEAGPSKPTPISLRRSARKRKTDSTESRGDEPEVAKKLKLKSESEEDDEFKAEGTEDGGSDDETTMEDEERKEEVDHQKEIAELQAEGDMPIEELLKKYGGAFDGEPDLVDETAEEESPGEEQENEEMEKQDISSEDEEEEDEKEKEEEEIGMDYLFKADLTKDDAAPMIVPSDKDSKEKPGVEGSPSKEITDVAAEAASLQPTGFTLATTQVVTPIPILLKHTLREYQHIGLDWLVTMYDKRLNGILADEMGLGKTIQTIALLAHLACDKGVWGPHLIVVPTSVMLNWEMEFKKWCPGFKILTYYGSQKERKAKRTGWTKSNAFHVCITSYKLVLQDNASFRRKKWKYLVLDEAQNIKNFKSQRWQTLLNFNSQRRLLLTGTPLQNNLMELWSLMHFLMPHVFQSHKEFKEWFSNPLTGMIEGSQEYNEKLVRRLHKVLRPFLLRRIKKDVEKQMPNKYEHVVRCHLSKRQRFLYDDFMSQASTKDTLESGHFMSVINILMQLRKVCNHPNLFEPRAIVSPFMSDQIDFHAPSLITKVLDKDPFQALNLQDYHLHLPSLTNIRQYNSERMKQLKTRKKLIEELAANAEPLEKRPLAPKMPSIKEQLSELLKERERQKPKGVNTLNLTQLMQHGQQAGTLPVLTLPITSGVQLSSSAGATRVITIPASKTEDSTGKTAPSSQSFTVQYQTPQGTRVAIPNKQVIRQIPGRVVQIMTPGTGSKAQAVSQPVVSLSQLSQAVSSVRQNGELASQTSKVTPGVEVEKAGTDVKKLERLEVRDPPSYVERLEQELLLEHRQRCSRMSVLNENRCETTASWLPGDTIDFLKNIYRGPGKIETNAKTAIKSEAFLELVRSNDTIQKEMEPVIDRFVFVIPKVQAKPVDFHVSHPSPSRQVFEESSRKTLESYLKNAIAPYHSVDLKTRIQFPEARLIQYDCGKLQVLSVLLRRFWTEKHKCLIFTQMTKVLDILEAFLSYHGYRYLRLDGSTRVEQRMLLMERFNNDARIFCFILSTRSGGIGVNLTGADTVIFYDSDWNPTMDAQAQDRCHRIGQTRDVHIYRLISERTVEENILKKANQKRLLGDLAIEGGSFTTAFFKEQAIKDLFNEPSGLEDLPAVEKDEKKTDQSVQKPATLSRPVTARQKAIAAAKEAEAKAGTSGTAERKPAKANSWEDALQQTEDKEDVDAANQLREEQDADMEEFTENAEGDEGAEVSKVHEEMKSIYEELTPIEKYALKYLEETTEEINREELELAEEEVHRSKQDWEIAHLMALKEEEERRLEEEEDEIFYTREDAENQIYIDDVTGEAMPVWFPPTPPQDESDIYIDPIARLLYLPGPMPEDQLPVIHAKKERKRTKTETESPGGVPSQRRRLSRAEIHAPRSLFNRPQSQLKRRETKPSKYRPQLKKMVSMLPQAKAVSLPTMPTLGSSADKENITSAEQGGLPTASTSTSATADPVIAAPSATKNLDWLINEDWKLLQAVQQVLEMPLSLAVLMPAHTPNWDLVADIVNSVSSVYRSPKMCKQRFENVIAPREEGRSAADIPRDIKKKIKGTKTPTKVKVTKLQKTTSMHGIDNNAQQSSLYSNRFDAIKETCSKRSVPLKTSSSTQFQRNPKHTSILMENGITYDKPLPPVQVASLRADRIAREKAMEASKQQQQIVQTQTMQGHSSNIQQIGSGQASKSGLSSLAVSQLTAIPLSGSTSNIIVNSSALSAITKKINQHSAKTSLGSTALQQTLLRSAASATDQSQQMQQHPSQIQLQQSGQGTVVTVGLLQRLSNTPGAMTTITTAVSSNNAIPLSSLTRPSISVPTAAVIPQGSQLTKQQQQKLQMQLQLPKQHKKPVKAHPTTRKLQITPETMKKLTQRHQQQQQQMDTANVVTVAKVQGKQRKAAITPQELEQLLKNQQLRRQMQKPPTAQVQIAPVHAQVQAQQVQEAAAQQAAQHVVTSKPLPITVPVTSLVSVAAVNLGGMNMSISNSNAGASGQGKPLVMTNQQVALQQQLQRQLLSQRRVTQQQQMQTQQVAQTQHSKVKQTVYAMVAQPLVAQGKRRVNVAASSTGQVVTAQPVQSGAQPVQLTVTKLLQSQSIPGQSNPQLKQPLTQQSAEVVTQQLRQQHQQQTVGQVASATIVPSSNLSQQRLITSQRQIRQIQQMASNQQPAQMILTPASSQQFLQRASQNVVASISIAASSTAASARQMTLSAPTQQHNNLSQHLQSLLRAQPQAGVSAQAAMRPTGQQQHHLVLSQINPQQTLSISPQNPAMPMTSPTTPTTMTLAPSLVQLPAAAVSTAVDSRSQPLMSQPPMTDGSGIQQQTSASVHYVTRTMPQQ